MKQTIVLMIAMLLPASALADLIDDTHCAHRA